MSRKLASVKKLRLNTLFFSAIVLTPIFLNPLINNFVNFRMNGIDSNLLEPIYAYLPVAMTLGVLGLDINIFRVFDECLNKFQLLIKSLSLSFISSIFFGLAFILFFIEHIPDKNLIPYILFAVPFSAMNMILGAYLVRGEKYILLSLPLILTPITRFSVNKILINSDYAGVKAMFLTSVINFIISLIMVILFARPERGSESYKLPKIDLLNYWLYLNLVSLPFSLVPKIAGKIIDNNAEMLTSFGVIYFPIFFMLNRIFINSYLIESTKKREDTLFRIFKNITIIAMTSLSALALLMIFMPNFFLDFMRYPNVADGRSILVFVALAGPFYTYTTIVNATFIALDDRLALFFSTIISTILVITLPVSTSGLNKNIAGLGWLIAYLLLTVILTMTLMLRNDLHKVEKREDVI